MERRRRSSAARRPRPAAGGSAARAVRGRWPTGRTGRVAGRGATTTAAEAVGRWRRHPRSPVCRRRPPRGRSAAARRGPVAAATAGAPRSSSRPATPPRGRLHPATPGSLPGKGGHRSRGATCPGPPGRWLRWSARQTRPGARNGRPRRGSTVNRTGSGRARGQRRGRRAQASRRPRSRKRDWMATTITATGGASGEPQTDDARRRSGTGGRPAGSWPRSASGCSATGPGPRATRRPRRRSIQRAMRGRHDEPGAPGTEPFGLYVERRHYCRKVREGTPARAGVERAESAAPSRSRASAARATSGMIA